MVLGGGVGHAGGEALAVRVQARLRRMSPLRTEVRAGALGGDGGAPGALLIAAREAAQDELFAARNAPLSAAARRLVDDPRRARAAVTAAGVASGAADR